MTVSTTRPVAALSHHFAVRTPVPALTAHLADLFSDLPDSSRPYHHRYELIALDDADQWEARLDGERIGTPGPASQAVALLLWRINRGAVEETGGLLLFHAGGVVLDDVAVLLPGDMEVGKSTIVTGLLRSGAHYLSDEAVGLAETGNELVGFGKAVSLDPGSWHLFPELRPTLPEVLGRFSPHQWQVVASGLPGVEVVERVSAGLVVLPRYVAGASASTAALGGADAILRLSTCVFRPRTSRLDALRRLARLLETVPCYEVSYGDLDAGVDAIRRLTKPEGGRGHPATGGDVPAGAGVSADGGHEDPVAADLPSGSPFETVQPRRDATLVPVRDESVVHLASTDDVHALNASATLVYRCVAEEVSLEQVVAAAATAAGQHRSDLEATVRAFVAELLELGLLERRTRR